jgi:cell division protein FtsL
MSAVIETRQKNAPSLSVILFELLAVAMVVAFLSGLGILHVTSRVLVVRMGYELSKLDGQTTELTRENDQLKLELATLKSPARLEGLARTKLGLLPASAASIINVKSLHEGPAAK